jgi:3-oxoisoapionate decarboxylase
MEGMRLGIGSYTWPWAVEAGLLDASGIVARAISAGLDTVQLCDNLPHANNLPNLATASSVNITIELGARGLASVPDFLMRAKQLQSPLLRLVIDTKTHHPAAEEIIRTISGFLPQLESQNVILALENHDRLAARTLKHIVNTINSPHVGICLDTANSIGAGEGLETVLEHLAPITSCLHLKDIQIRRVAHLMGFEVFGCEPGTGIVDFASTYATVAAASPRCQSVILEQWPLDISVEDQWAQVGIHFLQFCKASGDISP